MAARAASSSAATKEEPAAPSPGTDLDMTNLRTRKQQLVWLLSAFADLLPLKNRKRFPCKP